MDMFDAVLIANQLVVFYSHLYSNFTVLLVLNRHLNLLLPESIDQRLSIALDQRVLVSSSL